MNPGGRHSQRARKSSCGPAPPLIYHPRVPARSSRKAPASPVPLTREELAAAARSAVAENPGLKGAALKRALPKPHQKQHAEALAVLRELAAKGEVFRHAKGKVERFFGADPVATLDRLVPDLLGREGPLDPAALKRAVERDARGHGDLVAEWLKSALARRVVFEHAPLPRSRAKRYGKEPDLARLLAKTFAELRKALAPIDGAGVPRERVIDALRDELGLPGRPAAAPSSAVGPSIPAPAMAAPAIPAPAVAAPSTADDRDIVRAALSQLASEHRPGTLLLVHDLRARTPLDKERFDAAALALSREGAAVLHHHDHAAALSDEERRQLVADGRGTHYIGIAPRSPT